jgi:hypothetical protein
VQAQCNLLEIALALHSPSCLARHLDCRQQEGYKNSDDRNHHEQLDQRKAEHPARSEECHKNPRESEGWPITFEYL